jgi:phosphatidylserine/phosphatidylglycerophosphate/cardiolipin synthase-like enzyme/regulation of enolase protein 1 (concanavalin A-like superfamily)
MGSRRALAGLILLLVFFLVPKSARAQEVMCDPSYQDCYTMLLDRINNETLAIDFSMLFMEDDAIADAIIARHNSGVRVRALVEPRRNTTTPKNDEILARLAAAGIPMRAKNGGGMLHWKFMIFDAQNEVQFSAANYSDFYFRPTVPYSNYTDEGIYFTHELPLVNSFRRKFDDAWLDPAAFVNYANITSLTRRYALHAVDPSLNFVPFEDFATRSVPLYDAEQQRIDVIMYKITEPRHADAIIRAASRGIPVRLIVEGERYRNPSNLWQAYHVDRLYMAGVQIRDRAHEGFLHQKTTLLYGQGLTVFGSSNWTIESNERQYEHNYFTDKPWLFEWFRQNFERKWTNATGAIETAPFVPQPPAPPVYVAPTNGATGVATSGVTLRFNPGTWGHRADIYFGTTPDPPLIASNVPVSPTDTHSYALPALNGATTYYWRIVNKTMALREAPGAVQSFTTAGGTPPPANVPPSVAISSPANNSTFTAPASITVAANASDSDGTVSRVDFYAGATLIGPDSTAPYQVAWTNVPAGTYTLSARAIDNLGAATTSSAVTITVNPAPPPAPSLPAPWQAQDVGSVGVAGSASADNGTFTVRGAGADIWGTADAFHFVWQRVSGDVDVVARVASVEYVHAWVKAGVMIREQLTAGSAHALMLVSPGKGLAFQRRTAAGGLSTNTGQSGAAPAWVKLERRGNTIRAFTSNDGANWSLLASDTFAMAGDVHVGLAVSSHDASRAATAIMDNVSVTPVTAPPPPPPPPPPPSLPSPWQAADVGAVGVQGSSSASDGTFTVRGAGADIWGSADAFQYVWQPMSGDMDVIARVASVEYVHAWVKAGVMIRERLAADSPHALMLVSAGRGLAFQRRVATGGISAHTSGAAGTAPAWVKLERRANTITAFSSPDGATWSQVGNDVFAMGSSVYVGLAVSSHDATRTATATFDHVTVRPATSTPPPPPPPADSSEIVLYASDAARLAGGWTLQSLAGAAGGQAVWLPNAGRPKVVSAAAAPADYVEFTFNAEAGRAYRLWIRSRALNDDWNNDSVHVQFSGSVNGAGGAVYRIGTTSSAEYNLESCRGCGLSGWGWEDNGWGGVGVLGPEIYFATTGPQTIRIQNREDGLSIDQIVLSSSRYLTTPPGPTKDDTTIVSR